MKQIWTVGHSSRSEAEFLTLLASVGIERLVDVRRFPGSRAWPQFGEEALRKSLALQGIDYVHLAALGGRRGRPAEDSPNTGWRVASFAAYADYMSTDAFQQGLETLARFAAGCRTAMMCSEAVPWRCHRRLIADALLVRGWDVLDILSAARLVPHTLTPFACVVEETLIYPPVAAPSGRSAGPGGS